MVKPKELEPTVREDFELVVVDSLMMEDRELRDAFDKMMEEVLKSCGGKRGRELDTCLKDTLARAESAIRGIYRVRGYLWGFP